MQENYPLVTVLMPVYNAGPYISEAIDSILQQTFTDFEFLIINDGSADDSLQKIRSYSDPRIVVVDRANHGLIESLNEGLQRAKGEIIARMDADDVCLPNRFEKQLAFLKSHPDYVLVGSEADVMDKDGNFLYKLEPIGYSNEEISAGIKQKCPFIHPCVMFKKKLVIDLGCYPKNALTFEDHLLWRELLSVGKVCNLREVLLKVRFNPESLTIDEKWRGKEFLEIRKRSIENGIVSDTDGAVLKEIVSSQNFASYKQAAYYAMVGKKYLWNNPDRSLARAHFAKAIQLYPKNKQLYLLWLTSFLPSGFVQKVYSTFKRKSF